MKIVSWNCQGAFREKASAIAAYMPDIAVIQECECPEKLYKEKTFSRPTTIKWFGELKSKGLCIMSYTDLEFEINEMFNPSLEYCIPLKVKGKKSFNMMAVWTQNHADKNVSYIGQLYKAIKFYKDYISSDDTVIIGDFNSNQIWDKKSRIGNHSDVVSDLKDMGIVSLYHELHKEDHGSESKKTFHMYRKTEPQYQYHIDYCFAPEAWVNKSTIAIGDYSEWGKISDHFPLFVEFE